MVNETSAVRAAVAYFDTMTATAETIAAVESEAFIVGVIDGLRAAMAYRTSNLYLSDDYVAELRAKYEASIAVYVEALAIARGHSDPA